MLQQVYPERYAGLNARQASRKMQEVCQIAAESGQTHLAMLHLQALDWQRRRMLASYKQGA
jgi:hypothetical protein